MTRTFRGALQPKFLGLAIFMAAGGAHAQSMPPSNELRAEQLFRSGEKKFDAGRYPEACADFSESLKLGPKLGTLLNLALCHETIGKLATAWREFQHGAAWAAQNNQRERLEFATTHIRGLEPRLPRVVLQLPLDRPISTIDLDGEPLPEQSWYLPLYLDPGEHRIALGAPGKQRTTVSFRVTMSPTDQLVSLPRLSDASAPATEAPREGGLSTPGLVLAGVGGTGIVLGTVFGVLAMSSNADDSSIKGYAAASTISFVLGSATAAVGGYLLFRGANGSARVAVGPRAGGAELGLGCSF